MAAVDNDGEVSRLEAHVEELTTELAAANEAKSRLETQCEESRQRAALDADEQLSQLQNELQASTDCLDLYFNCASLTLRLFGALTRLGVRISMQLVMKPGPFIPEILL